MSWGIFPLFFAGFGSWRRTDRHSQVGLSGSVGRAADRDRPVERPLGPQGPDRAGMWVQASGLFLTAATRSFEWWFLASVLLGFGTAMVYPTLIASVSDASHPSWRARSLSVYRFWRDLGYAIGALSAGIMADLFGAVWAITAVGALTVVSGTVVAVVMNERRGG